MPLITVHIKKMYAIHLAQGWHLVDNTPLHPLYLLNLQKHFDSVPWYTKRQQENVLQMFYSKWVPQISCKNCPYLA